MSEEIQETTEEVVEEVVEETTEETPEVEAASEEEVAEVVEAAMPELTEEQIQEILKGRKFMAKVDGEEKEVDIDTMLRDYQLAQASQKRFKDASAKQKQAEEFFELLRRDPRSVLSHPDVGVDINKFAEDVLAEYLEDQQLTPEQRELRELKAYKAQKEKAAQEQAEAEAKSLQDAEATKWAEEFNDAAPEALKSKGLPANNLTMKLLRDYAIDGLEQGYDIPINQLASLVKEDYQRQMKELFSSSQEDVLRDIIGEEGLKKVRNIDLDRIKDPTGKKASEKGKKAEKSEKTPKDFKTLDEYFEYLHETID